MVLVSFNLASCFERKNPLGAIAAFRQAFGDRRDRILLIKVGNPHHFPADCGPAARRGRRRRRISGSTPARCRSADAHALTRCADIVLSLHRSEGFGLVPAEAMLLGRPVIATDWSGNMDFMTDDTAALVGYRLIPARDPRGVFEAPARCGRSRTRARRWPIWSVSPTTCSSAKRWAARPPSVECRSGLGPMAAALAAIGLPSAFCPDAAGDRALA